MERIPSDNLNHDELQKLVLQLQKQLASQAKLIERQAKRIEELESELKELRKKNPTLRLEEAYSVKAEEKRREEMKLWRASEADVRDALTKDIGRFGEESLFVRIDADTFTLRAWQSR